MNSIQHARYSMLVQRLNRFYRRWIKARELTMCRAMLEAWSDDEAVP